MATTPRWLTALRVKVVALEKAQSLLKQKLMAPPPMAEGRLNVQYRRCGKDGCACMRKKDPVKHGPYHYLVLNTEKGMRLKYLKDEALIKQIKQYRQYNEWLSTYEGNQSSLLSLFREIQKKCCHD
jgi:hypothetical protein